MEVACNVTWTWPFSILEVNQIKHFNSEGEEKFKLFEQQKGLLSKVHA